MTALAIHADGLHKDFAGEQALKGVAIAVRPGTLYGLIGADGAGKTTLLRILTTLTAPDAGTAAVLGLDVKAGFRAIRTRIGYMPQKFSLYGDLTVRENLMFFADIFDVKSRERTRRMDRLLQFSRLGPFQDRRARDLSGGMKQKLALSCALIHTPELLFLDEPTIGVDPVSRKEFWDILKDLKRDGMTIVVSTPYMDEADLCDELAILHRGVMISQGPPAGLLAGYPHRLFRVASTTATLSVPRSAPLPQGVALMYPAEGAIHAAVSDGSLGEERLLSAVKALAPKADEIRQVAPTIEDLFFLLLSLQPEVPESTQTIRRKHGHSLFG